MKRWLVVSTFVDCMIYRGVVKHRYRMDKLTIADAAKIMSQPDAEFEYKNAYEVKGSHSDAVVEDVVYQKACFVK